MPAMSTDPANGRVVCSQWGGLALVGSLVVAACAPLGQDTIPTTPPPATLAAPTAVPDLIAALTRFTAIQVGH